MWVYLNMEQLNDDLNKKNDGKPAGKKKPLQHTDTFKIVLEFYIKTFVLDFSYN